MADKEPTITVPVKEYDLATNATPSQVTEIFEKVFPTGIKHGTVTLVKNNNVYEINQDQINSYTLAISAANRDAGTYLYTASVCCDTDGFAPQECTDSGYGMFTKDLVIIVKP